MTHILFRFPPGQPHRGRRLVRTADRAAQDLPVPPARAPAARVEAFVTSPQRMVAAPEKRAPASDWRSCERGGNAVDPPR